MTTVPLHHRLIAMGAPVVLACLLAPCPAGSEEESYDPLATATVPEGIVATRAVEFARAGDPEIPLRLDIVRRAGKLDHDHPQPLLLFIHGGGWRAGSRGSFYRRLFFDATEPLIRGGLVVFTIDYRLAGKNGATTLDSVRDCRTALRYIQRQARAQNLDMERIAVMGGSAGGHLSLMTAIGPNPLVLSIEAESEGPAPVSGIKACVPYYPLCHFGGVELHPEIMEGATYGAPRKFTAMLGGPAADNRHTAELLSPITHLRADMPAVLLLHGDADPILPVASSRAFAKKAAELKAPVTYIEVAGGNHGFRTAEKPDVAGLSREVTAFLADHLQIDLGEPKR